jgi:hypothetical protein
MEVVKDSSVTIKLTKEELTNIVKDWVQRKGYNPDQVYFDHTMKYDSEFDPGDLVLSGVTIHANITKEKIEI